MSAHPTPLPALGQPLAGGIYAGITTAADGTPYALILLADKPAADLPSNACTWADAMAWAESRGNGAQLPTRPEAALLFALLKPQFEEGWHWTGETDVDDSSFAWGQDFIIGYQDSYHECYAGRARAVRRLPLQSFNPSVTA
jgi:hypothetical protein